jgi:HEPN domain-containing protein
MPDMSEADRVKEDAARALAIAIRAWEHGKFELADILTAQAAQHLDDAALIEAADEERLKKAIGEIERVSAELKLERAVADIDRIAGDLRNGLRRSRAPGSGVSGSFISTGFPRYSFPLPNWGKNIS